MSYLVLKAYLKLICFEFYFARDDFAALRDKVHNYPIGRPTEGADMMDRVIFAVDMACIWYWKEVHCVQRSAAAACLLKRYGVQAQMVIGAQRMPVKAHAWVEVDGRVVNDKPYIQEMYEVLDRC